jgi:hypothetical protein
MNTSLTLSVALKMTVICKIYDDTLKAMQINLTAEIFKYCCKVFKQAFLVYGLFRHDGRQISNKRLKKS